MQGQRRRHAIRKYGRGHATGFFLAMCAFATSGLVMGHFRNWLLLSLGQGTFLAFATVLMFASLLLPSILWQTRAARDPWLYCPHCNEFLASLKALRRLNKDSKCVACFTEIEIAPIEKWHARNDIAYILGGLGTVLGILMAVTSLI